MAPPTIQHRRTHNLLLISKLLNQRDAASPFTLVLDSLEQSAKPLLIEYIQRAKLADVKIIFVALESLAGPHDATVTSAWKNPQSWRKELVSLLNSEPSQRKLIIFDSLNALAATESSGLPALLSSFISPTTSLLAVYHQDVVDTTSHQQKESYSPASLTLLKYLATTIITTHSLHHVLARKAARERSHAEPSFGLEEGIEGVLQGRHANELQGTVLEMEYRRRSGRGVREWYYLPSRKSSSSLRSSNSSKAGEAIVLLEDHPQYRGPESTEQPQSEAELENTFELGLTEKQRRDRDGVVLPYFDAQKGEGDGGRILYDMGSEDDFDEEEDEI